MNPFTMTIINPRGSNQQPPVLKSAILLTELWGSAANLVAVVTTMSENIKSAVKNLGLDVDFNMNCYLLFLLETSIHIFTHIVACYVVYKILRSKCT